MTKPIQKRSLRICYWDSQDRHFGRHKALFEDRLKQLGTEFQLVAIDKLNSSNAQPCDLLIIATNPDIDMQFDKWLLKTQPLVHVQNQIRVPTIFFGLATFNQLHETFGAILASNWYFDIIHPDHLDSAPIRIANLLRIHDHMHELLRYDALQRELQAKIQQVELELKQLRKAP